MADCGSSGSALDRTARSIFSSNGGAQEAAKQVASVLGHALGGASLSQPGVRPLSSPDYIVLPAAASVLPSFATKAPQQSPAAQPYHPTVSLPSAHGQWGVQQQQAPMMMNMNRQHQNHYMSSARIQMAATAQQQQQMMLMNQQQQQMHFMIQQNQQRLQQQQHQQAPTYDDWHQGLDKEALMSHLKSLHDDATVGHEGIVKGASIAELAEAWTQANDDIQDTYEDTTNLWSGGEGAETYEFQNKEAPETAVDPKDWMKEGMRHFDAGNLNEAIRAFEMEVQHSDLDNALAWRMLGRCHAENDMDQQAILCLEQAVDRDPYSPESLLALGVSYVNELNHDRALENLNSWITHNPTFAGLELDNDHEDVYGAGGEISTAESAFNDLQRLLLRALDYAPSEAANVLEALGVVYNVSRDYDAAADAFRRAIDLRVDDYQLWNKLGATLANGQKSEEALPAYNKALQLKPKYARAWLNMAISYSNLHNYDEAARCYLQMLSLNPSAMHCWSYLRIALSCSERWDLIPLVASRDLKAFREHFDFVLY
jgi:peroxin-5